MRGEIMKNIIMVKALKDDEQCKQLNAALTQTRLSFTINIEKGCILIEGDMDMVMIARRVINEAGYTIM